MNDYLKLTVMNLQEAKDFQKKLSDRGVDIILDHNEQTCTRGCAVTVEVHVKEKDLDIIRQVHSENYSKMLEGHDINIDQLNAVFDSSADKALCPACGFEFKPSEAECPDCGLIF